MEEMSTKLLRSKPQQEDHTGISPESPSGHKHTITKMLDPQWLEPKELGHVKVMILTKRLYATKNRSDTAGKQCTTSLKAMKPSIHPDTLRSVCRLQQLCGINKAPLQLLGWGQSSQLRRHDSKRKCQHWDAKEPLNTCDPTCGGQFVVISSELEIK